MSRSYCRPLALLGGLALLLLLGAGGAGPDASAQDAPPRSGAEIYQAACASCHGPAGQGMPQPTVGFAVGLPDFSDCSFGTREPNADWYAVAHDGGPVRVFDKMMPAFGDALSEAEIEAALDHLRTFCAKRESWPRGELNLPRAFLTSKAFPEDEAVYSLSVATEGNHAVLNELIVETRLGARGQIELAVPFGFLEQDEQGWTGGLGDIALGTKWAFLHSLRTGSILSAALEVVLPSGREDRGLGKGETIIEPFLAYGQLLPADSFIQLQAGAEVSTDPDALAHEVFWRGALGMGFELGRFGRAITPMVEVAGARELEEGAATHWDVIPQLQVALSKRQHLLACAGARIPLTEFEARTTQFVFYLLWDWFDGGLLEGW